MESFLSSTTKHWNDLPDFIKISPTLSSFKKHLKEIFCKTPTDMYHFGARRCYIIHCQLRNCSSNLYKDLFDHYMSESPACRHCDCKTEDTFHYSFFKCSAYNNIRDVLFENVFNLLINEPLTLDLLMFGNPNLDIMTNEVFLESVHECIKLFKRLN